jgi:hypothetical protein
VPLLLFDAKRPDELASGLQEHRFSGPQRVLEGVHHEAAGLRVGVRDHPQAARDGVWINEHVEIRHFVSSGA